MLEGLIAGEQVVSALTGVSLAHTPILAQAAPLPSGQGGLVLVSWWKAVILLIPLVPWAWYVSKVLDKHAARFLLPREKFNIVHLSVGTVAILLAFLIPMQGIGAFLVGLGALITLLLADVLVFISVHNRDPKVPEKFRLSLLDFSKLSEPKKGGKAAKGAGVTELTLRGPDKSVLAVPQAESPDMAVRIAAEKLYIEGGVKRASQVELGPSGKDNSYAAVALVDGVPQTIATMPAPDAVKVMDLWKSAAKLDLAERRKKLSGDVTVERADLKRKVRITTTGSQQGLRMLMVFEPETAVKRDPAELGLLDQQKAEIEQLTKTAGGLVLLAGPADGGRTTTFYTVLRMHDAYTTNVQTLEMEPQLTLEGVRQTKFEAVADGPEYSTTARSILRRDPDVLGIAELPDAQTGKEIARADLERARVYVSVRADNAVQAAQGWVKLVGDPDQAVKHLRGVVAQRLLRKLCGNCKMAYAPSPDMVKKLGLPAEQVKQLFKKGGQVMVKDKVQVCPQCDGVGYFGQEGVFEIVVFTDADRAMMRAGDWNGLKLELRKRKIPTIQQAALRKALDGVTSVEEVLRVTAEQQAPAPAAPAAPAPAAGAAPKA